MQQESHAQFLQQAGAVVAGAAVHGQTNGNAQLQHFGNAGDTGGQLHVGDGAVCHAGAGLGQQAQFLVVEVDAVGIPYILTDPAQTRHVLQRTDALALEHEILLILGFAQVGVQTDAVLTGQDRALAQQLGGHGEGGAGGQRNAMHGAIGGIVILLDQTGAVGHNLVNGLHDTVRRQTAVLFAQIHTAAAGIHTDAQLVGGGKLRADQIAGVGREDIVMVKAGGAAVLHQLTHAGQTAQADHIVVKILPDLIQRSQPVKQLHVLHLRQVA